LIAWSLTTRNRQRWVLPPFAAQALVGHRVRLQPPHRARGLDDLEQVSHDASSMYRCAHRVASGDYHAASGRDNPAQTGLYRLRLAVGGRP
jgi:hypothetical protein